MLISKVKNLTNEEFDEVKNIKITRITQLIKEKSHLKSLGAGG